MIDTDAAAAVSEPKLLFPVNACFSCSKIVSSLGLWDLKADFFTHTHPTRFKV